jgi:hypothetical protein
MDRIRALGLKATTAFNPPRLSSRDLISRIPQNRDDVFSETVVGLDHQDFLGFIVRGLPGTRELAKQPGRGAR